MKKFFVSLALVGLLAMPALADPVLAGAESILGPMGNIGESRGPVIYQNLTPVAGGSGQDVSIWWLDDLTLDWTTAGVNTVLDTVTFSVYYSSTAPAGTTIDLVDVDVGFWFDDSLPGEPGTGSNPGSGGSTYIGGTTTSLSWDEGTGLAPGQYTTVTLEDVGIDLGPGQAPYIFAGTHYDFAWGTGAFDTAKLGQILVAPPTVGSSEDYWYVEADPVEGAGTWYWFGGPPSPAANFLWELTVVPEPATFGLLVIGGLVALRRRR